MSKAEDKAKEFLKKLVSHTTLYKGTIDELEVYEPNDVIWAYKEGYHQAEKDNELTWEDMRELYIIFAEVDTEIELCKTDIKSETIGYYQEVLKRFKAQKGEKV